MRITPFLLTMALLQVNAKGISQNVTYRARNVSLEKIFNVIKHQTGFVFFYHSQDIAGAGRVDIDLKNVPLEHALEECLKGQPLTWSIQGNTIVISIRQAPPAGSLNDLPPPPPPNLITIRGRVLNQKGEPVAGVTVSVKGGKKMASTNDNGEFTLTDVDGKAILEFSGVSVEPYEIRLNGQTDLAVTLTAKVSRLNEVVIVGYGTQKKVNLSGSVATVNYDQEMQNRPITDVSQALSGVAAGVSVSQTTGQPGRSGAVLRVRGVGTLNGSDPLVLIDGVVSSLDNLNPNDVASITILKDAASASIYGSRAAGGVILVNTIRGKEGKAIVRYNGYAGIEKATRLFKPVTDYPTYMKLMNGINKADNPANTDLFKPATIAAWQNATDRTLFPNTNWIDIIFDKGSVTNHNVSISSGNDKTDFYLSMGYRYEKGIMETTDARKYSLRLNLDHKLSNKIKVGANIAAYYNKINEPYDVSTLLYYSANSTPGTTPYQVKNGVLRYGGRNTDDESNNVSNPLQYMRTWFYPQTGQYSFGKLFGQWSILKDLQWDVNGSAEIINKDGKQYKLSGPIQNLWNFQKDQITVNNASVPSVLSQNNENKIYLTFYSTLHYNHTFGGEHHLSALAGVSREYFKYKTSSGSIQGFPSNNTWELNAGLSQPKVTGTSYSWALSSYFSRLNYDYKGKYIVEGNLRYDGSSRFASDNHWGLFPSFSAAWRLSEEGFFKNAGLSFVDDIKIRGSWGKLGNQNIDLYQYMNLYSAGQNYVFGNALSAGLAPTKLANPNITWESTTTSDAGADVLLLRQRLSVTFDWYDRRTNHILVQLPLSSLYGGLTAPYQNVGIVRNRGWEVALSYKDKVGDVSYSVGGNLSYNTNKVLYFQGNPDVIQAIGNNSIIKQGLPINALYGYVAAGTFKSQDDIDKWAKQKLSGSNKPGDLKYVDIKQDGVINGSDRTYLGTVIPKYTYGFNAEVGYRGIVLSALFQGVGSVSRYFNNLWYTSAIRPGREINTDFLNAWSADHPNSNIPRLTNDNNGDNTQASSFWVQNAAFLRLKNVQLSYTLPAKWIRKAFVSGLQVYADAQNPITWTKYKGLDPETGTTTNYQLENPNVRIFTVGINASF
ncbi:MAG: TonB-dependent receptor [Chitinophagaceae bacterium]|nr:TonB-dependent receptor [Chitinophagaceae bacterium]